MEWRFFVVVVMLWASSPAFAASVSLSVPVPTIGVGQGTRAVVRVSGVEPQSVPEISSVTGLQVRFRSQSSKFSVSPEHGLRSTFEYVYVVTGEAVGDYQLGPVKVPIPGRSDLISAPVSLRVVAADQVEAPTEELTVTTGFSRESVWEGEVVLYEAEVVARLPVTSVSWRFPQFEGLQLPARGQPESTQHTIEDPGGEIKVLRQVVPLIAAGTGDRSQPPAVAEVNVATGQRDLFGRARVRRRREAGQSAGLKVRPLPKPPANFSGLVGTFSIRSELKKSRGLAVGESVPWTVSIVGTGVADGLSLPELKIEGARVYEDGSETIGRMIDGRYISKKVFKRVLVPTDGGRIDLKDLSLVVFDPEKGEYSTIHADLGELRVRGKGAAAELQSFANDDTDVPVAAPVVVSGIYTYGFAQTPPLAPIVPLFGAIFMLPTLLVLGAEGGDRARQWWSTRVTERRSEIRGLARLQRVPEGIEGLGVVDLALRESLADATGVDVSSLRRQAAVDSLPPALAERFRALFARLDRARFAQGELPSDAADEAVAVIKALQS